MKTNIRFGVFAALITALLTSGWLTKPGAAQSGIRLSMQPSSPISMPASSVRRIDFVAENESLDELTSLTVGTSEEACAAVACPVILERGIASNDPLGLRLPITISMPALPNDYDITRSFFFTATARGVIYPPATPNPTGPIPLELPHGVDQTRPTLRVVTVNFTMTVSGSGARSATITPVPGPPTATPTAVNAPPTPTFTPEPTLPPLTRRFYLPLSSRLDGPEIEPNNDQSGAQRIVPGTIIRGSLNDSYDVFKFTLPTTTTVNAELSGIPDNLSQRVQLRLDPAPALAVANAALERNAGVDATITLQQTLGPGTYIVYIFTDPAFLSPNTAYQLRFFAR
jgi:hypothetical protein